MSIRHRTAQQQQAFDELVREIKELRPLPAVALHLLAMAADDRFSSQDLARTINADQALTLRILRLANSAMFGLPRRITTLRDAVVLLGFREVRAMALAACVIDASEADLTRGSLLEYGPFWRNSLIVGLLAQVLAEAEGGDGEEAFTAGVVHNVGRLAWAQRRPTWLRAAVTKARELEIPVHEAQMMFLGFTDADTGAAIVRNWSFPELLCTAVAHHAKPLDFFECADDLDAVVARTRCFTSASGITDGIDQPVMLEPDAGWTRPKVENALQRLGGIEGVVERAGSYLGETRAA